MLLNFDDVCQTHFGHQQQVVNSAHYITVSFECLCEPSIHYCVNEGESSLIVFFFKKQVLILLLSSSILMIFDKRIVGTSGSKPCSYLAHYITVSFECLCDPSTY